MSTKFEQPASQEKKPRSEPTRRDLGGQALLRRDLGVEGLTQEEELNAAKVEARVKLGEERIDGIVMRFIADPGDLDNDYPELDRAFAYFWREEVDEDFTEIEKSVIEDEIRQEIHEYKSEMDRIEEKTRKEIREYMGE